jgi:hypothetical protein
VRVALLFLETPLAPAVMAFLGANAIAKDSSTGISYFIYHTPEPIPEPIFYVDLADDTPLLTLIPFESVLEAQTWVYQNEEKRRAN